MKSLYTLLVALFLSPALRADETIQDFPANPGAPMQTRWRVVWDIGRPLGNNTSQILYIREAYFTRSKKEPEMKVLGDCRLAEIFVPYNDYGSIYDLSGHSFDLERLGKEDLGPACILPPTIYKGLVAHEVHDDHLRWKDAYGRARRGQEMHLWSVLDAANYRYIMLYVFRDDGSVSFRLGATAHNLFSEINDAATHMHTGIWRLNLDFGDTVNQVSVMRYHSRPGTSKAEMTEEPLEKEARIVWKPEEFTKLRFLNLRAVNGHDPANNISYELVPRPTGTSRQYGAGEEFSHHDLWVTKLKPATAELFASGLPGYENSEPIVNQRTVLWHQASVLHVPRDEDFGEKGYESYEGVALTAWAGFELRPRNFFSKTPLYP